MAKVINQMAVIFPFEIPYYQKEGVPVAFVGHPLIDVAIPSLSRQEALERFGLDPKRTLIGLLPGSRKSEIKKILPPMLGAAKAIQEAAPMAQFAIPVAHTIKKEDIFPFLEKGGIDVELVTDSTYDLINASKLVVVASGTATLEAALLGKPMVIVYKTSWINYLLGKMIINVEYLGMVNLIARKAIVPELIQAKVTADGIFREVMGLLKDAEQYKKMKDALTNVVRTLGEKGASERVAQIARRMIQDDPPFSSTPKATFKDEVMANPMNT
jgi:lipid-A-disaccharide synthase